MPETDDSDDQSTTRRGILAGVIAAVMYGLGWLTGGVTAQTSTSGNIASASEPAEYVYVERVHVVARTSDPSSPDDGTLWYNESA